MEMLIGRLDYFLLFLFRTGAFLGTVPVIGISIRNRAIKVSLVLLVSLLIFPVCAQADWERPESIPAFAVLIAKETFLGLYMSFVVALTFHSIQMAGNFIGMEMGLSMAAQSDPITGSSTPLIAYFYEIVGAILFLSLNFHHWLFQALSASFEILPVGSLDFSHFSTTWLISFFGKMFVSGLILAAPVFVVMSCLSLAMGLLARAVPNFNLMDSGGTLRVIISMLAMFVFFPSFLSAAEKHFGTLRESLFGVLKALS